jgi:hypothetical protein
MTLRKGLLVAALVAAGVVSVTAFAGGGHGGHHGGHGRKLMEQADADGNGALTRSELDAFNMARAQAMDLDEDGAVTVEEMRAFREQQRAHRAAERMSRLDADKDGRVTLQELADGRGQWLARLDADRNGEVTVAELHVAGRQRGHHRHGRADDHPRGEGRFIGRHRPRVAQPGRPPRESPGRELVLPGRRLHTRRLRNWYRRGR